MRELGKELVYDDLYFDTGQSYAILIDKSPDKCPICHVHIKPTEINAFQTGKEIIEAVFQCTNDDCNRLFIGYYHNNIVNSRWCLRDCLPKTFIKESTPKEINDISPEFEEIYNQAKQAEENNLNHIAGMGYRKALEFLIKDFLINHEKCDKETIEKNFLGKCIDDHIEHEKIKDLAKRAAWLGNDESHFVRKWEDKSIEDLKILIALVVSWISHVVLTEKLIKEMPE